MKKILATAYAINPYKGSEDGMGWNFVLQIARFHHVIAITRENNRPEIEKFMLENPDKRYNRISFQYFDLPLWMRFWKKGSRGAMLYYLMWQWSIVAFIKKQKIDFDIVHNLNFHNDWTPSFLWKLNKPFVWGHIGHHPMIPNQYLKPYPIKYLIKDRLTWMVKIFFWKLSPSLKKTIRKADHILCMNKSVSNNLGLRNNYSVSPSVATQDYGWHKTVNATETFTVISAGRFVPLKGFDLSIQSFARFYHALDGVEKSRCRLVLVGSGPEETMLRSLAKTLQIDKQVQFIAWIERENLMELMKDASVFLFPSHEGAGMVVAEALSFGLPVVCLDNQGPGQFINAACGFAIPQGDYSSTVAGLANAVKLLYDDPEQMQKMRIEARKNYESVFHWDRRGELLQKIYAEL